MAKSRQIKTVKEAIALGQRDRAKLWPMTMFRGEGKEKLMAAYLHGYTASKKQGVSACEGTSELKRMYTPHPRRRIKNGTDPYPFHRHYPAIPKEIPKPKPPRKKNPPRYLRDEFVIKARKGSSGPVLTWDGAAFSKEFPKVYESLREAVKAGTRLWMNHRRKLAAYKLWADHRGSTARP